MSKQAFSTKDGSVRKEFRNSLLYQQNDFQAFIQRVSKTDDTWKFWAGFVLVCARLVLGL